MNEVFITEQVLRIIDCAEQATKNCSDKDAEKFVGQLSVILSNVYNRGFKDGVNSK